VRVRSVLVVGGGIAGSTCAYFLARNGISTTVVERAGGQRSSGSPVDVRGPALAVVEQMAALEPIRAAATRARRLAAVDRNGREIGWIPTQASRDAVEISRGDLAAILVSVAGQHADFLYEESVTALRQDDGGVEVTFQEAESRRFDVVIGADGLHSTVRRLAFGPEEHFVTHLGLYFGSVALARPSADPQTVLIHNAPGRAVVVHPVTGEEGAGFMFWHPELADDRRRDVETQKQLVSRAYRDLRWRVPELLDRFRDSDEIYFDSVCRVELDCWSRGRTVLVGDAATTVSLFGEGSSMAIAGAATLAQAVAHEPTDIPGALRRYEQVHRSRLRRHHRGASAAAHLLVPQTRAGLMARDAVFRTYAAGAATSRRIRRSTI